VIVMKDGNDETELDRFVMVNTCSCLVSGFNPNQYKDDGGGCDGNKTRGRRCPI
jgi:hypothetical protein